MATVIVILSALAIVCFCEACYQFERTLILKRRLRMEFKKRRKLLQTRANIEMDDPEPSSIIAGYDLDHID